VQIGFDASVEFEPIAADTAQAHLQHLCDAYLQAWAQPLPVAAKTACAYIMGLATEHKDPMGKAQTAFNGAYQKHSEYQDSPALQRVFNSFEDIQPSLADWADRLYAPMHKAAKVIHLSATSATSAESSDNAEEAGT
jgi:exodeoxyribonuclease V gamma subunit